MLTCELSLEQDELVVRKSVQFGSFMARRGGCITEAAFLVLDSEHERDIVKDVNISYKDIGSQTASSAPLSDAFKPTINS